MKLAAGHTAGEIIPVLDLQRGQVVRAVGGRRREYRPVCSCLAHDSAPRSIAAALVEQFGFHTAYVADLDAISGAVPDWRSLDEIAASGLRLLVDAGLRDYERSGDICGQLLSCPYVTGTIVALESVADERSLRRFAQQLGAARAVFSVDLRQGRPLTTCAAWETQSPLELATLAVEAGFRRLVVLDLAAVGMSGGPALIETCRAIRRAQPQIELNSGGGVRDAADVRQLLDAGCDAVLVASALHDGRIQASGQRTGVG